VLQMRIDMGVVQMETDLRPDGQRPGGAETYYDYLVSEAIRGGDSFRLSQEQCAEADREFVQYYQRRLCWLSLREYRRAAQDADHSLAFMDFVHQHSPDEEWTLSHEQYRPFVLFHRVQAGALAALEDQATMQANVAKVRATRARLSAALEAMGFRVVPSQTNFVLARGKGESLEGLMLALKERGVLVRWFRALPDALRVSVGTDPQIDRLLDELRKLVAR
ncbi:MAG: aminotransferase class I/II-fold pyridoxal phosphate-dependent enzyme, partial [Alphaproteobacteria bacterium]